MFEGIKNLIKRLFSRKRTVTSDQQQAENEAYNDEYMDTSKINFNAIFSNSISTLTVSDCTCEIPADNKRAELLNEVLQSVWSKIKKITSKALGTGGCIIVPYVSGGKIFFNVIKQNRLIINGVLGDKITAATVIAESLTINDALYYRLVNYEIVNNTLYITHKSINAYGAAAVVEEWENIQDIAIANVDRVPFGFIKSPVDNRKESDDYGVPITYGCDDIKEQIMECLKQIRKEFKAKKARLQVDDRAFAKDPKTGKPIVEDDLYMAVQGDPDLFNIFDPAFRESSYHARLDKLYGLFEKQVGTDRGILTEPETRGATATEIKNAVKKTFAIITDTRKAIEKGLEDFIYACDVLANYYNLTPPGKYQINFDWDYSLIESSTEKWQQMQDLQAIGGMSKAELRAWQTGESIEEAQKAVDEISKKEPDIRTLVGMSD